MQQCNSRSYPRNSDKISLSRAPTAIYNVLPFRWFLFLIDRERRSMQQCNSRSYPRNSDKISLSRAPTAIYIILPFRWFLFLIDRESRSMQQCNLRSYPRNSDKISLSRALTAENTFTVMSLNLDCAIVRKAGHVCNVLKCLTIGSVCFIIKSINICHRVEKNARAFGSVSLGLRRCGFGCLFF